MKELGYVPSYILLLFFIDDDKERDLLEWYEYPLLEALKIDKNEKYELKESFYANFIEMQKIWKGKAKEGEEETEYHYDFLKRNCQQFVKCLFEKSTGKKLPKHIQEKI